MNDIVDQLREFSNCIRDDIKAKFVQDAADEIQRLRNRIAQLEHALDGLGYLKAIRTIMDQPK